MTDAPPETTSAFVNFCLPIAPSIGSTAERRYALKAQPKSEIATPVKRRSIPLISRDGNVRPHESWRATRVPLATSEPDYTLSLGFNPEFDTTWHLPIVDGQGRLLGMLSVRNLLQARIDDLTHELDCIEQYANDSSGG